jgi:hypothetical protein
LPGDCSFGMTPSSFPRSGASRISRAFQQVMPGRIAYELLNSKQIDPSGAQNDINETGQTTVRIDVTDTSFKADACGGPVTVRLGVTARMSTRKNESESNAYGDNVSV